MHYQGCLAVLEAARAKPRMLDIKADASLGDILREVKARGMVEGELLVLPCDVIFTGSIKELIAGHQARAKKDQDWVLTLPACSLERHSLKTSPRRQAFLLSKEGELMQWENLTSKDSFKIEFLRFAPKNIEGARLHHDLELTSLAMLSHDVLKSFKENF